MFSYLSLLVEEDYFKKIEVFFLIVGHTHASIDQYFSVLARDIYKSEFIGSPLALAALLAREKFPHNFSGNSWSGERDYKVKPLLVRKIQVVYDMKSELHPHINHNIYYYPVPHRYIFLPCMCL
jgi:hypothetical protein